MRVLFVTAALSLLSQLACGQVVWDTGPGANGHTYRMSTVAGTPDDVRAQAYAMGGYLASITSPEESAFLLANLAPSGGPWIGLADDFEEGTFRWDSGEPLAWTNWCGGSPPMSTPTRNGVVWESMQSGCWTNRDTAIGSTARLGIIEIPPDTAQAYRQIGAQHLSLNGNWAVGNDAIRLTSSGASFQRSSAFREGLKQVPAGFMVTFEFDITGQTNGGGEGFAFVLHADQAQGPDALGGSGWGLGYGTSGPEPGITDSLAVEFDLWGTMEPDLQSISIHTNGDQPNHPVESLSIGRASIDPAVIDLSDGQPHTARVRYLPGNLEVYLDDLATPVLVVAYDLVNGGSYLDGSPAPGLNLVNGTDAWIGVTASTDAMASQNLDVRDWRWNLLVIENPGFEADVLAPGASASPPAGWAVFGGLPHFGFAEGYRPVSGEFPWSDYSGENVLRVSGAETVQQALPEVFLPGWSYKIQTTIGEVVAGQLGGGRVELKNGTATVVSAGASPSSGQAAQAMGTVKILPAHTAAGQSIIVNVLNGLGGEVYYDDIRVVVTPAALEVPQNYATIQAAVDAACPGQTIRVGPGTYNETVDFGMKSLTLRSTRGAAATTIEAQGLGDHRQAHQR